MKTILILSLALAGLAGPALADTDLLSAESFTTVVDVRLASSNGEASWTDGGFGKARFGDQTDGLATGIVEWRPKLSWSWRAVVDLNIQPDVQKPVDLGEAYIAYKPLGDGGARLQARAGLFYPPVSMEHDGVAWTTPRTITPSAINSWVGEEVFGAGLELSARREIGGHQLGLTAGAVGKNDTAGTLLTFRGWSLNDVRATLNAKYELPPLSSFARAVQDEDTYPAWELDDRIGYYVRADWTLPAPLSVNVVYYDNLGDMVAVDSELQWSWYTRFVNVGAAWRPAENTEVLAQWMKGVTRMGYTQPAGRWFDTDFESAYVLVSRTTGRTTLTGRADYFRTDDQASPIYGDTNETGWAATAALRRQMGDHLQLFGEVLRTDSKRPSRAWTGLAPRQIQTTIQVLARVTY